jgi:oligoendopeptidase F
VTIEGWRVDLTKDISRKKVMQILHQLEDSMRVAYKVYAFSQLWFNEDTQNQDAQTFVAKVQQFMADFQNRTLFFSLWWRALDDANAERLMSEAGDYRYYLQEMRNFKPHTLTEAEEKIINIKDLTGTRALHTLFDTITNRYIFEMEVDGEVQELTRDELMVYAYHHEPDLRKRAYQEQYRVFGKDAPILGQLYQYLVRDWSNENVGLRKFASPISVRNLTNDVPDEVVDTLLDVCQKNTAVFQRYFRLKARWLGIEQLRRYDIYAPVVKSDKTYEFGEAIGIVLDAFGKFDPLFARLARRVFDSDRVDSDIRKGKQGGAFCYPVIPELTPWVLLNYKGNPRDIATMAHELGHANHAMLASEHTLFTYHSSLPLAETASTFGEMLLVDYLLEVEDDEGVQRDLLFRQVDDAYATIMRQAFFALYEREAHELIHQGASINELSDAYLENLRIQFGDAVELSDEFRWEWVSIPHIYSTPFYVYAYAFGQLLVMALYKQFKEEGETFKSRYLKILSAGGSDSPAHILTEAGIDIRSVEFWQGGFDVILELVEQLEKIPIQD